MTELPVAVAPTVKAFTEHSIMLLAEFFQFIKKSLTNLLPCAIIMSAFGRLAQLVEHPLDVRKVAGSSPTSSTIHPASSEAGFSSFVGEKLAFCLLFSVFFNFSVYFSVRFAGP